MVSNPKLPIPSHSSLLIGLLQIIVNFCKFLLFSNFFLFRSSLFTVFCLKKLLIKFLKTPNDKMSPI